MFSSALGNVMEELCGWLPEVMVESAAGTQGQQGLGTHRKEKVTKIMYHTSRLREAEPENAHVLLTPPCKEGDWRWLSGGQVG